MGDLPLWLLVAAFTGWELFAHFVARNRGEHTLSNRIWAAESRIPGFRVLVLAACLVLTTHLTAGIP